MTMSAALAALYLWRWRTRLSWIVTGVVAGVIGLHLVMKAPVWYLLARIDLTGSSTSYYRAELITQAIGHLNDWWLTGTDYTRNWMPTGVNWSGDQVDLVNYYIKMGVTGGLLLMLLFIAVFWKAFQSLGRRMRAARRTGEGGEWPLWCVGMTLFAYSVAFIGVSPFDQSYVFCCLALGAVPGIAWKAGLPLGVASANWHITPAVEVLRETDGRVPAGGGWWGSQMSEATSGAAPASWRAIKR